MAKSILFTGRQGTGKTTKIKTLLNCLNPNKVTEMTVQEFISSSKTKLKKYDFIAIDEVTTTEQLYYLLTCLDYGFSFILATQLTDKLSMFDLSMFHIVELG